jgi:hypothetical protein
VFDEGNDARGHESARSHRRSRARDLGDLGDLDDAARGGHLDPPAGIRVSSDSSDSQHRPPPVLAAMSGAGDRTTQATGVPGSYSETATLCRLTLRGAVP